MKKRNGNIELMRFIFCWVIIFFHTHNKLITNLPLLINGSTFSGHGRIGVEFFFLVSGYLMAKSAEKYNNSTISLSKNTLTFVFKKIKAIFPYHIVAFILTEIVYFSVNKMDFEHFAIKFISIIPNFFLIQKSGIHTTNLMGIEWYLSAMFIAMLIIYPLIIVFKDNFKRIVCPILTLLLMGYLCQSTGSLSGTEDFTYGGVISKMIVRAIAELCFGVFIYEVVKYLKRYDFTKATRILLTVIEAVCYIFVIVYSFSMLPSWMDFYAFYAMSIAVAITFGERSYFANHFNNKFFYTLGKWSLPLYLSQNFGFNLIKGCLFNVSNIARVFMQVGITIVVSLIVMFLGDYIAKKEPLKKLVK